MPTFIMLTRLNPDAVRSPRALEQLERDAMKRVREECPNVEWLSSYAVLGPCDSSTSSSPTTSKRPLECQPLFARSVTQIPKFGRRRSGTGSRTWSARCRDRPNYDRTLPDPHRM